MNNSFLLCLIVGISWSGAPFLARITQLNPWIMASLISIGTLISVLPFMLKQDFSIVSTSGLSIGLVAGILNGIGILAWYRLVAGSNEGLWELSNVLPVAVILLTVALVIGGWLFFKDALTMKRILGLVLACSTIWLLK